MTEENIKPYQKIADWQLFCALVVLNLAILWFVKEHFFRLDVFSHLFQEQLEVSRLEQQLQLLQDRFSLNYLLVPLSLFVKLGFLAFLVQFPLLFLVEDVSFKKVFRAVMIADLAMVACSVTQYVYLFLQPVNNLEVESFGRIPLSLAGLMNDYSHLSGPAKVIVNRLNIFELGWCALIYNQLKNVTRMMRIDILLLVAMVWTFLLVWQWLWVEIILLMTT